MQRYEFYSDSKVIILKKIGTYCFLYGLYENPEYNPYPFSKTKIIMASFKLKFRPSTLPEQEGTLYFQVIHRKTVRMIHTGFHIRQDEWNDTPSSIRIAGTPERQNFLRLTASKIKWYTNQLTAIITEMETKRVEVRHRRHRIGLQTVAHLPDMVRFHPRHGRPEGKGRPPWDSQDLP